MKIEDEQNFLSEETKKFIRKVARDYDLTGGWKTVIWNIEYENECIPDMKLIYLWQYPDSDELRLMFLHEVAHALLPNDRWHSTQWVNTYYELINTYLPNVDEEKFNRVMKCCY